MITHNKPHGPDEAFKGQNGWVLEFSTPTVHRYFETSIIMYPSTRNSVMMICSDSDHQPEVSSNKKRLFMLEYLLNIFIRPCPLCSGFCTTVHHRAQRWEFAICACTIVPRHFCTPPFTNSQVQFWTNLGQLTLYLSRSSTVLGWSFNSYAWNILFQQASCDLHPWCTSYI